MSGIIQGEVQDWVTMSLIAYAVSLLMTDSPQDAETVTWH